MKPNEEPTDRGNHSPREGELTPVSDPDQEMRDFVRSLFAPTD
jgi:hypothetical protein